MSSHRFTKTIVATLLCAFSSFSAFAQSEWEDVVNSNIYFKWGGNGNLQIESSTLSNLSIWNYHAETRQDKKNNTVSYESVRMPINWKDTKPYKITFTIENTNRRYDYWYRTYDENGKEVKHNRDVYWGLSVDVNKSYGTDSYKQYFDNKKQANSGWTYTSGWNSDRGSWTSIYDFSSREIRIEYDNNTIKLYFDWDLAHTFYGANSVSAINVFAGPAAYVKVTNFRVQRKTAYAEIKPFIDAGNSKFNQKDYWGAIEQYTKAIDKGHRSYDVFYKRASCYYEIEFYANAIDDYTKALACKSSEEAYLYRGLAKLAKDDATGLDDLKKGGAKGQALYREIEAEVGSGSSSSSGGKYQKSGTGFFLDARGYIATNYHVIESSKNIDVAVTQNGKTTIYSAKSIISDKTNDLAIIKITDPTYVRLSAVPYSIGSSTKDVGTKVFAMGYPFLSVLGTEIKVTDGIISSKTGYQGDITTYQISAPIQRGNSGGPLFDNNGTIVGITNAGVESMQNVGYAIKVSYLRNLIDASSETINLPTTNQVSSLSFTEKVKKVSPYVVIVLTY